MTAQGIPAIAAPSAPARAEAARPRTAQGLAPIELPAATPPANTQARAVLEAEPDPDFDREFDALQVGSKPPALAPSPAVVSQEPVTLEAARHATAYQIGDLDLAPKPAAQPVAAKPTAPAAAKAAPSAGGEMQSFGDGFDDADAGGAALELDGGKPWQKPPAGAKAPATDSSGGAMQSFGDGFDDAEEQRASLELDKGAGWREEAVIAQAREAKSVARASTPRVSAPRVPAPPRSFIRRMVDAVQGAFATLGVAGVLFSLVLIGGGSAATAAYMQDADAFLELVGLRFPYPVIALTRTAMQRGALVVQPRLTPKVPSPSSAMATASREMLHPLLRLAPPDKVVEVATFLRGRVPNVIPLEIEWPKDSKHARVDCMLLEHPDSDAGDRIVRARIADLLRTGLWTDMPPATHQGFQEQLQKIRAKSTPDARFTPICLAL